jgi:SPP1 gp7 family putative phage head morphogenesis protein
MPSQLERAANRFRRELLNNERQAASAMVRAYGSSWRAVSLRVDSLQRQIAEAQASGETVSPAWFYQYNRAQSLQAQIEAELRRFSVVAGELTTGTQAAAVEAARRHTAELVDLAAGVRPAGIQVPFDVLPTAALQDLVGFASDGSPLRDVFGEISGGVADRVTDTFAGAIAAGLGPRETAQLIRRQFGTGLVRALLISRTETLRSYREASHRNYERNADVLEGWIWHATLNTRTCAACWAMHGTFHELKERLDDHPNGRCTPVPALKPWKALGYNIPDNRPKVERGPVIFERLTAAEQERVLGKAAFAAWSDGAVSLEQFAAHRHDRDWGDMVQVASLRSLLGPERAMRYIRAIRAIRREPA